MIEIKTRSEKKLESKQGFGFAVGLLLVITAFLIASWIAILMWSSIAINSLLASSASSNYPTCVGEITGFGNDFETDLLEIFFAYEVDGKQFKNATSRDPRDFPSSQADSWDPNNMGVGSKVTVYYSPEDPQVSRLVPGILPDDWMFLMATPILVVLLYATWKFGSWMLEIYRRAARAEDVEYRPNLKHQLTPALDLIAPPKANGQQHQQR